MQAEASPWLLQEFAGGLRLLLETLSVATVLLGLLDCLRRSTRLRPNGGLPPLAAVRLSFGSWLSLALEFQLGADIVATTITPGRDNLIRLAVVAVIRTFLNLFLGRELEAEQRLKTPREPAP
jgi:uncharacterized membrane protein